MNGNQRSQGWVGKLEARANRASDCLIAKFEPIEKSIDQLVRSLQRRLSRKDA